MKMHLLYFFLVQGVLCISAEDSVVEIPESEIRLLEGEYSFNPSDTDEMAIVRIKFRRPTKQEGMDDEWRADGAMHNSFHGTVVSFKGAVVYKDGDAIVVYAQFFGFKLHSGVLTWLENYQRELRLVRK